MPERTTTVKSEDGTFDINQEVSGSCEIIAFEFADDSPRMTHRPVEVGGVDVDGVDRAFEPAVTITGHLRWEDKAAATAVLLQVSLEQDEQSFSLHPSAEVKRDGSFGRKNAGVDSYSVNVSGPGPDAYLKRARYGSSDALGNFRVSPSSGATLDLVGSTCGAHIHGVVMNSDPVPVSGVWITLIPEDSNRDQKCLFQSGRSRANGRFEFCGVAPATTLFLVGRISKNTNGTIQSF